MSVQQKRTILQICYSNKRIQFIPPLPLEVFVFEDMIDDVVVVALLVSSFCLWVVKICNIKGGGFCVSNIVVTYHMTFRGGLNF